jgi:hypothetical protein
VKATRAVLSPPGQAGLFFLRRLPSSIRIVDLLSWLKYLDIRLRKDTAVSLLKSFENLFVDVDHRFWILE